MYLSKPYVGKAHDFGILKQEFEPGKSWFNNHKVKLDLGFYGFKDLYKCKELEMPHKKPKNEELDEQRKVDNKSLASSRVKVEHAIGGLKRYRILTDRLRCKNDNIYSEMLGICAGLWNFRLNHSFS